MSLSWVGSHGPALLLFLHHNTMSADLETPETHLQHDQGTSSLLAPALASPAVTPISFTSTSPRPLAAQSPGPAPPQQDSCSRYLYITQLGLRLRPHPGLDVVPQLHDGELRLVSGVLLQHDPPRHPVHPGAVVNHLDNGPI